MPSLQQQLSRLVYSTEQGEVCPACRAPINNCNCQQQADEQRLAGLDGIIRIRRETAGGKGKGVTSITGVPLAREELKKLAAELKKRCGTGGAVKDDVIEIQGDQREVIKTLLESRGFRVKLSGG